MASFEDSLKTRLMTGQSDPPETDLDYYARPENYTGSNLHALQRIINVQKKQVQTGADTDINNNPQMAVIIDRYKDVGGSRTTTPALTNATLSRGATPLPDVASISMTSMKDGDVVDKEVIDPSKRSDPNTGFRSIQSQPPGDQPRKSSKVRLLTQQGSRAASPLFSRPSSPTEGTQTPRRMSFTKTQRSRLDSNAALASVSARDVMKLLGNNQTPKKIYMTLTKPTFQHEPATSYERRMKAQERFRHAIRIVLILLKWISSLSETPEDGSSTPHNGGEDEEGGGGAGKTFTDIASEAFDSGRFGNTGLTFDLSYFKAKKVINISAETRHILSIPSNIRSSEQIQTALYGLQHLKSFAEYPLHMQEKLCKVAWFQQVPAKRVIIRQGHFAENFYFILSGQAVVRILEKHPKTGDVQLRTATILRKGTSFGELALLHHSRRTATVVSQDTVQLLTIGRDDFFDIFMSGNGPGEIPDHIKFISQLDFMKDWPIDNLLEHPECCLFHFFKRGVVIVKDSTQSDWLYIIKSGSCQVMKQLKGVRPKVGSRCKSTPGGMHLSLPRLGTGEVDSKVDTGRQRSTPHSSIPDSGLQRAISNYSSFIKNQINQKRMVQSPRGKHSKHDAPPVPVLLKCVSPARPRNAGYSKSKLIYHPHTQRAYFSPQATSITTQSATAPSSANSTSKRTIITPKSAQTVSPLKRCKTPGKPDVLIDPYFDEERLVLKDPVFVQVQILKPKDVFGLGTVEFENEPATSTTSVSLVSNGAECIMMSKKYFVEHANELVKRTVRYSVRPYPPETALQQNLQSKVDWDVYKKRLIRSTIDYLENGVH